MGLCVEDLDVFIGNKQILYGIDLEVKSGEFFSLLGASGCGKTTLLKTIAGLLEAKNGNIFFDDIDLLMLAPQKRGTVIVFQDQRLFANMTVGENVSFALRNQGVSKKERIEIAKRYLDMVQMSGFADRRVHQLSGGQAQRIALARALAANPRMLLLDEPFSALDENLRGDMRVLVKKLQVEMNITTVMVTHDQKEALAMSDRIGLMDRGNLIQIGTPAEIYHKPKTLEAAMYFSDGDVVNGIVREGIFRSGKLAIKTSCAEGSYKAIIRTTALRENADGINGIIGSVQYQGDYVLATIKIEDVELHCILDKDSQKQTGDQISISIDPNNILYFPINEDK